MAAKGEYIGFSDFFTLSPFQATVEQFASSNMPSAQGDASITNVMKAPSKRHIREVKQERRRRQREREKPNRQRLAK